MKHRSTGHTKWVNLHEDEPTVLTFDQEIMAIENGTRPLPEMSDKMATPCLHGNLHTIHTQWLLIFIRKYTGRKHFCRMISSISEIPDLNKYATKTFENDCFVDLEGGELCLSYLYLLAVISV